MMVGRCVFMTVSNEFRFPEVPDDLARPFVFVNCAVSADGKMALPDGRQTNISSDDDIAIMYKLRNWADAVVVGINTVLKDNPKLTVKEKYVPDPNQPLRVVVDSCCRTPAGSEVLSDKAPTIIATIVGDWSVHFEPGNVDVVECGSGARVDLRSLLSHLWKRGVRKVMVEGGGTLIASFLKEGLVDEFMVFIGDMIIGGKEAPNPVMGVGAVEFGEIVNLERYAVIPMERGVRLHYRIMI